ncbi:MAG: hypothetical protein KC657_12650 [Myxococcales bacterium]|nr:hypothetical protein [Myxococcales bacterium]
MLRELLSKSPLTAIPMGTLLLFIILFVVLVIAVYGRRAAAWDPIAHLALEGEDDALPKEDPR